MKFFDAIEKRRSVRRYTSKSVPDEVVEKALDAALKARFFKWIVFAVTGAFRPVVRSPRFKSELFEVVTKTTALACQNFMLAITAQGYGSCPMEGFDEKRVKKVLDLKSSAHVVMVISVGDIAKDGVFGDQHRVDRALVVHEV